MKLQIPLSTTAHTPPLTTEEGSQSVESFYKTQINHYNHKHITFYLDFLSLRIYFHVRIPLVKAIVFVVMNNTFDYYYCCYYRT